MSLMSVADHLLLAALVLAAALYGLAAAGHFPAAGRRAALSGAAGAAILWGSMAVAAGAGLVGLRFAWLHLPPAAAVIVGGGALLVAPLVLQPCPDSFVDGRRGLVVLAALAGGLALAALVRGG